MAELRLVKEGKKDPPTKNGRNFKVLIICDSKEYTIRTSEEICQAIYDWFHDDAEGSQTIDLMIGETLLSFDRGFTSTVITKEMKGKEEAEE